MKPELFMCNYYGMCDENGKSVGHTIKVTKEYADLLSGYYNLKLLASPSIINEIEKEVFSECVKLRFDISIHGNNISKRILDKFKLLYNINQILRRKGIFFFYQVDFFFFFYMFFLFKKCSEKRVYCLIYHQDFTGGRFESVLKKIYHRALSKIDGVIYTQKSAAIEHNNSLWMPDFLFDKDIYGKYLEMEKLSRCVCVGTMNRYRQLEELVDVFSEMEMQLVIVGRFDDKLRYQKLLNRKSENIEIRDGNISYSEYLELLGTSRYSILPYDMNQYINRTSGVLLESIYVGCIPIAPKELLEQNSIPGWGYDSIRDILDEDAGLAFGIKEFEGIREKYDKEVFANQLSKWFS